MASVKTKFSSCFAPAADDDPQPSSPSAEIPRRKKYTRRSFSGFVKAVLFPTPLLKKLRSKRSSKSKSLPAKKQASGNVSDNEDQDNSSLFSSRSSSSIASSDSSGSSSGSDLLTIKASTDYTDPDQTNTIRRHALKLVRSSGKYDCIGLMFIILVCLVALVFWGKAFAVVTCTSAWLFLAPRRGGQRGGLRGKDAVGWAEHKKRVIMEGLLERNIIRSRKVQ